VGIPDGVDDGKKRVIELGHDPGNGKLVNGWMLSTGDMGTYGTNYLARAGVAWVGLGANLMADAVYPMGRIDGDGNPLNGATGEEGGLRETTQSPHPNNWIPAN